MKLHVTYFSEKTKVTVRDDVVEIKAFQIIVWMSLVSDEAAAWDSRTPRFPAILDIGTTHNFAMTKQHLVHWAGIQASSLGRLGRVRLGGLETPLYSAGLWLHTDGDPYQLQIQEGLAIFDGTWPRLPVLGLRALTTNRLQTFIYGDTKQVLIRTPPPWYWPF